MSKIERFNDGARMILSLSQLAAEQAQTHHIEPYHVLLALAQFGSSDAGMLLAQHGVTEAMVKAQVDAEPVIPPKETKGVELGETTKRLLELSVEEAQRVNNTYIGTLNLLIGVLRVGGRAVEAALQSANTNTEIMIGLARAALPQGTAPTRRSPRSLGGWLTRIFGSAFGLSPADLNFSASPQHIEKPPKEGDELALLNDFIRLYPTKTWAFSNRAHFFVKRHQYAEAIADYTALLNLKPDDPTTYYNRAACNYFLKQFDAALADIDAAIRLEPSDKNYAMRGSIFAAQSDYETALKEYDALIRRSPKSTLAYALRANALLESGEPERALQDCARVLDSFLIEGNEMAWAYIARGTIALDRGDMKAAQADFLHANHLDPDSSWIASSLALLYLKQQKYADAQRFAEEAIRLLPFAGKAYYALGAVLAAQGDQKGAVENYRRALEYWTEVNSKRSRPYADEIRQYIDRHGGAAAE
jgi:tetratricopeptide (TPR) repeat protein